MHSGWILMVEPQYEGSDGGGQRKKGQECPQLLPECLKDGVAIHQDAKDTGGVDF